MSGPCVFQAHDVLRQCYLPISRPEGLLHKQMRCKSTRLSGLRSRWAGWYRKPRVRVSSGAEGCLFGGLDTSKGVASMPIPSV